MKTLVTTNDFLLTGEQFVFIEGRYMSPVVDICDET